MAAPRRSNTGYSCYFITASTFQKQGWIIRSSLTGCWKERLDECQAVSLLWSENCLVCPHTVVFVYLASSIATFTEPDTLNASVPLSIFAIGMMPGEGIDSPSWW